MNVASIDLCKELEALTNWRDTYFWSYRERQGVFDKWDVQRRGMDKEDLVPRYDSGYILDKLVEVETGLTLYHVHSKMSWEAFYAGKLFEYGTDTQHLDTQGGMNPPDALCELAIKLHKEGVLENGKRVFNLPRQSQQG